MHKLTAYDRRESLSKNDLERLRSALMDDVGRYEDAIRGYDADKMASFGTLHLAKLQAKVDEVSRLLVHLNSKA